MIGDAYWSSGIMVAYDPAYGWRASARYYDDGFATADADSGEIATLGTLESRYFVPDGRARDGLTAVIDTLKADVEDLGVRWRDPALFVPADGDPSQPLPVDWRTLLNQQASRLGWENPYPPGSDR